jgi:transposase-like protein
MARKLVAPGRPQAVPLHSFATTLKLLIALRASGLTRLYCPPVNKVGDKYSFSSVACPSPWAASAGPGPRAVGEEGAVVSVVARQNGVDQRQLSQWRNRYKAGKLRGMNAGVPTVPISELADAKQRIRALERELGRKALENAKLREAIEFAHLPASAWRKPPRVRPRKK